MPNSANRTRTYPEESLHYPGWRVVIICQIGVLSGIATIFFTLFTLFIKPWQQDFGWNREQISQAFSLAAITVAICSPIMGRFLDRFEPRKLIAGMMVAFGLGFASLAWLTPSLGRFEVTAVFIGIAGTGTYQLGYARIVASWFERRLGMALSVVVAGSGLGSLFIPPLVQHSITVHGWRPTILILSALPFFIGAPLTFFFAPSPAIHHARKSIPQSGDVKGTPWKHALATRAFWLIVLGVGCMSLAENGVLVHLVPMLSDRGLKAEDAAFIVSILGGSAVAGRLLLGWVLDYVEGASIAMGALLLAASGIFLLGHAHSFHAAALASLVAGLGMGCEYDLIPYMLKRYFGMRSFSTLYGLSYSMYAVAGGTAPLLLGYAYDATGSYTRILSLFSFIAAGVALAMLTLPAYRYAASSTDSLGSLPIDKETAIESH
ncbi:MAG TPA: MFS transporter [Candidatus Angelobacter sp.]|nr:MFS transporter [Candidatus Angelobacter sp.]